jgi:hypothetical protein
MHAIPLYTCLHGQRDTILSNEKTRHGRHRNNLIL